MQHVAQRCRTFLNSGSVRRSWNGEGSGKDGALARVASPGRVHGSAARGERSRAAAFVPVGPKARSSRDVAVSLMTPRRAPLGSLSYDPCTRRDADSPIGDHLLALGAFESLMVGVTRQPQSRSRRRDRQVSCRSEMLHRAVGGHLERSALSLSLSRFLSLSPSLLSVPKRIVKENALPLPSIDGMSVIRR